MNHLLPPDQARFKVRSWNAAHSAAKWSSCALLRRDNASNLGLMGGTEIFRFEPVAALSSLACAVAASARFVPAVKAQVQMQTASAGRSASSFTVALPNRSLVWTSTGWPRYARCSFSASRSQPVPATQLKR